MGKHKGGSTAEPSPDHTRLVRRLRRQCGLGVTLAALVLADLYLPGAGSWAWLDWVESSVGGALVFDVAVRPVLPTEVVVRFGSRDG